MMKKLLFAAMALLVSSAIFAEDWVQKIKWAPDNALYQINGKTVTKAEAQALDAGSIESVTVVTQEEAPEDLQAKAKNGYVAIYTKVHQLTEQEKTQAQFKGGQEALDAYLAASVNYPEEEKNKDPEVNGYVVVKFMIQPDGAITDPQVVRSLTPACDAEALRVVKLMPNWEPGKAGGVNVLSIYQLPILFKAPKSDKVRRGRPAPKKNAQ